jgi:type IV pilus assembly protein PilM
MAKNTCWGIDVGQSALKALKLRLSGGEIEAVSFDVIEHAKILSQPDADEQQLIRNALDKFLSRNDVKNDLVVVGVPGQASFSRFIKLPPVELKKVPEIVKYEARQQIPFDLAEVIWDYQTMTMPTGGPAEIEVGIFAMKRDIVLDYVNDFTQVKITPDKVQMGPVALYNYLQFDRQDGAGATLLVDVGAENTNLVIADGYRVWIRNFPLGGNNFTQALVKSFKLTFAKAENLKRHAAESKYAREVFQAMRPVFSDLLTEIQRSIGFYTSLHRESRIERVLAMGNSLRLPGLQKFLSQNLGVEVQPVTRFNSLKGDQVTGAPVFKENTLSFGVAYGLALQGLGMSTITTSLLPPEIVKEKAARRKRPFVIAAAVAVVAGFCLLAYGAMQAQMDIVDMNQRLGPVEKPVKGVLRDVHALKKANAAEQAKFDAARQALIAKDRNIRDYMAIVGAATQVSKDDPRLFAARDYWYKKVLTDLWAALPQNPRLAALDPTKEADQWARLEAIEILKISGKFEIMKRTDPASEGLDAAPGLGVPSDDDGIRVLVVDIEGTIPSPGGDGAGLLDKRLLGPLRQYNPRLIAGDQYRKVQEYQYEDEDPHKKAAEARAAEPMGPDLTGEGGGRRARATRRRQPEDVPGLRRPWRGDDWWFKFRITVNLDNPKDVVEFTGDAATGGGEFGPGTGYSPGDPGGPPPTP